MSFIESATTQFNERLLKAEGEGRFIRESAWEAFSSRGLPTRRVENWRYTPLRILNQLPCEAVTDLVSVEVLLYTLPLDIYTIIIIDGVLDQKRSSYPVNWAEDPQPAQINPDKHPLGVLNLALSQGGIDWVLEAGTIIDKPIALVHINTAKSAGQHRHLNHRFTLGEGAKASVMFYSLTTTISRSMNNVMIQANLKENAHLGYYLIQNENQDSVHVQGLHVEQAAGSNLDSFILSLGAKLARFDISTAYLGSQASAHMNGVYSVSDKQHVDIHLNAEHVATHCTTHQHIRGLADGQAKAVFNGRVCVHQNAVKSYSEQSNHNLLLSATAEIDTKPELEIYNDDVKCAHGATVGQLDQDALFYLMARGISKHEALAILRQAFVEQQFESIQDERVRGYFKNYFEARR